MMAVPSVFIGFGGVAAIVIGIRQRMQRNQVTAGLYVHGVSLVPQVRHRVVEQVHEVCHRARGALACVALTAAVTAAGENGSGDELLPGVSAIVRRSLNPASTSRAAAASRPATR